MVCPISSIPSFLSHDSNAVDMECRPVTVRCPRSGQVDWIARGSDAAGDEQQRASQKESTASEARSNMAGQNEGILEMSDGSLYRCLGTIDGQRFTGHCVNGSVTGEISGRFLAQP